MIRNRGERQEARKRRVILTALFLFFWASFLTSSVLAQTPTPKPSPESEETLEDKIQDIREAVKEKVQERIETTKKSQKRAWVGPIKQISNLTLTLETRQGEKQAQTSKETIVIGQEKKTVDFEDLEIDNYIIAMGYVETNGLLDTRRIVVTEETALPSQLVAFGEVTDKSKEENILTVKHLKKETIWSVEIISKTVDFKGEEADFEEIEIGDQLVAIGTPDGEENFLTAKTIKIIASTEAPSPTPKVKE